MTYSKAYKIMLLMIMFLHVQASLKAQSVYISGSIDSKDINPITIAELGLKGDGDSNKDYKLNVLPDGSFSITIKHVNEGIYKIKDAFIGHKIFISPGDTVRIQLKKIANPSYEIFHKMNVTTHYPMNYMFFDSCLSFFGHSKPDFSKTNFDDRAYKMECDKRFQRAVNLLTDFHEQKQVTDSFFKYAMVELKSNYFHWLLFPLTKYHINKESFGSEYFTELNAFPFDDMNAVEKTQFYIVVAFYYNNFVLNNYDSLDRESWFSSSFKSAANYFKGIIRDRLMANKIEEFINYKSVHDESLDSMLSVFMQKCETLYIKDEIAGRVEKLGLKIKETPGVFIELLNKSLLLDIKGNEFSMNSLRVKKRWILIDCWASWCKPCKLQDPFYDQFKQKYKDSISFLKFSLDEEKTAWENDIRKYRKDVTTNYLVKGGNENPFSYFFEIKAIPRFILIDLKNKKVVNDNMPFPEHEKQFEQEITKALYGKAGADH